ncbi:hypothetical protein RHGRI_001409 [Rhododendron griersonianum]|uniref:MSP domain-containing protein n=1 Tax=Rhododendron griersonianum TaxID=479676 RepID=A0AAV6LLA3_9ERIC|nr:hypothetical protein RHGRI_001409 [Rhododendron griersonianum]
MSTGDHLNIQPSELKFPFELRKQSSCSMQLTNKTGQYVAFKVKTTNPKKYCVRPNNGIVSPDSACNVTGRILTLPNASQCKRRRRHHLICSAKTNFSFKVLLRLMVQLLKISLQKWWDGFAGEIEFNREDGKVIEEFKLRVIYIPANPPSPVPEGSEEGSSPRASAVEEGNQSASLSDAAWSLMSKLTEEKAFAIQKNQKLCQELEMMRREISKSQGGGGFSVMLVALIGLIDSQRRGAEGWVMEVGAVAKKGGWTGVAERQRLLRTGVQVTEMRRDRWRWKTLTGEGRAPRSGSSPPPSVANPSRLKV